MLADPTRATPLGITFVALFYPLSLLWLVTGALAAAAGKAALILLATLVVPAAIGLAYGLQTGSRPASVLAVLVFGLATLWRLTRVLTSHPDDLSNAVVGLLILFYLFTQYDYYRRPTQVSAS